MIYHAFNTYTDGSAPDSWWAVHAETLTPVLIDASKAPLFALRAVLPPENETPVFSSHPDAAFDLTAIYREVSASIRTHICRKPAFRNLRPATRADAAVPEYLLVFDAQGENPAICRTSDPHLIIPASEHDEMILGQPLYWRTATDLPVTGWEYWWTDCQLAWDKLAPDMIASAEGTASR